MDRSKENLIEEAKNHRPGLVDDISTASQYLCAGDKVRIRSTIDRIDDIVHSLFAKFDDFEEDGIKEYITASSSLKSFIAILPRGLGKDNKNNLFNKLADYLIVLEWVLRKCEGYDVPDDPWRLPDEGKESSSGDDGTIIPGEIQSGDGGMEIV